VTSAQWTLIRFVIVGATSSLSYSLIFAAILRFTDAPVFVSSIALFCIFIGLTFQAHKHFTFGTQSLKKSAFFSYALLQICCFSMTSGVSANFVSGIYLLDAGLYLATVGFAAILSFLVGKFVIFRPSA